MIRFFNPALGYIEIKEEIDKEIERVLLAGDLILRKDVEAFEMNLSAYIGTKYAVALNSGTDALYLALKALHIGIGDEVLVPSRTFVATAQVVKQVGANLRFYDMEYDIESLVTEQTKAIIPAHVEGEFDPLFKDVLAVAEKHDLYVIEDACQALGAFNTEAKSAGSIGDIGCFSFYPAKILGAYGDGGALVTDNEEVYNYVKEARNHFKTDYSDWGINSRLDNIQAAILNVKMKYLPDILEKRQWCAEAYSKGLRDIPLELPEHRVGRVWQDYVVRTPQRDALYEYLKEKGVETMKNEYPFPVPKLPFAEEYEKETLRLPCNELLTDEEISTVIELINKFYE